MTSFVRADVIPQLADAREVLAAIDVPAGRRAQRADPQRARPRRRARAARPLRGDRRLPVGERDAQPRATSTARVDASLAGLDARHRPGPRGRAARRGGHLDELRLPLRGRRRTRARARRSRAGSPTPAPPRSPSATRPGWRTRSRSREHFERRRGGARRRRAAHRALPQHARPGPRERARRAAGRLRVVRVELRRARRLPGPAGRDRQHRQRGPRLDAARDGDRDRDRPRRAARRRARGARVLGRPLGSHTLVAGPVRLERAGERRADELGAAALARVRRQRGRPPRARRRPRGAARARARRRRRARPGAPCRARQAARARARRRACSTPARRCSSSRRWPRTASTTAPRRAPASSPAIGRVDGPRVRHRGQRRDGQGRRVLPDDASRSTCARRRSRCATGCRASTSSTPAARSCRCRTRSSPTASTSAGSSSTRRTCRRPGSRRSRR